METALSKIRQLHGQGATMAGSGAAALLLARACMASGGMASIPEDIIDHELRRRARYEILSPSHVTVLDGIATVGAVAAELNLLHKFIEMAYTPVIANYWADFIGLKSLDNSISDYSDDPLVARSQRWLRERYWYKTYLDDLARAMAVSRRTLSRKFELALGVTPHQYVMKLRLEAAMRLIERTKLPISQISTMVGYSDIKYFRNLFAENTGKSPAKYRASLKDV